MDKCLNDVHDIISEQGYIIKQLNQKLQRLEDIHSNIIDMLRISKDARDEKVDPYIESHYESDNETIESFSYDSDDEEYSFDSTNANISQNLLDSIHLNVTNRVAEDSDIHWTPPSKPGLDNSNPIIWDQRFK
jgi:hypothetical protein